jgi:hypothetical protein
MPHILLRADFRDYLTTFPRQQIVPHTIRRAESLSNSPPYSASVTSFKAGSGVGEVDPSPTSGGTTKVETSQGRLANGG